ncbi:hypothetical protein [Scytonema sp. NUACC21]
MGRTVRSTEETGARDCPHEFWGNQVAPPDPTGEQSLQVGEPAQRAAHLC